MKKHIIEQHRSIWLIEQYQCYQKNFQIWFAHFVPNEDSLTFSAVFEMNAKAEIISEWFGKGVINSDRRFAYEEVQQTIEEEKGEMKDVILPINRLATILRKKRFQTGAINFESQEVKFNLDENSKPIGIFIKESKEANWLIEEFMLG